MRQRGVWRLCLLSHTGDVHWFQKPHVVVCNIISCWTDSSVQQLWIWSCTLWRASRTFTQVTSVCQIPHLHDRQTERRRAWEGDVCWCNSSSSFQLCAFVNGSPCRGAPQGGPSAFVCNSHGDRMRNIVSSTCVELKTRRFMMFLFKFIEQWTFPLFTASLNLQTDLFLRSLLLSLSAGRFERHPQHLILVSLLILALLYHVRWTIYSPLNIWFNLI